LEKPPTSITCSPCTCTVSSNTCLPSATITANSAACPANGASGQPFDGPDVWDGTCTTQDAVSSAESVTFSPVQLGVGASCTSGNSSVTHIGGAETIAQLCGMFPPEPQGLCPSADQECAFANATGFSVCKVAQGEASCSAPWTVRHLFFQQNIMCACACGNPVGELGTADVKVFSDSTCSQLVGSGSVSSDGQSVCVPVPPGSALGSKSSALTYTPGTCEPMLTKTTAQTLCCLP
jgi:hypothetical protein